MSDFTDLRTQIQEARHRLSELDTDCRSLRGQLILLDRQIAGRLRKDNLAELPAADPLAADRKQLLQNLATRRGTEREVRQQLQALEKEFHALGDPQQLTPAWEDHFPCLLLPLRLQTRFVQVQHIARGLNRENILDISGLPGAELLPPLANQPPGTPATPFRLTTLQALSTGNAEERRLFKELRIRVRRGEIDLTDRNWLAKVAETRELWVRVYPDEIFTHTFEKTLVAAEVRAGENYWREVWAFEQSFHNLPAEQATDERRHQGYLGPWRALERTYGAARAGWIYRLTRPGNYPAPADDWSGEPAFPEIAVKEDVWTRPPRSYVMPDRFVVRLYRRGNFREVVGRPVVYPLALGLDPQSESEEDFTTEGNRLRMPDELRWLTDFAAAEEIGMAIRIVLSAAEYAEGFDQLIVLGLRLSSDAENSQQLVDQLLDNHTYKPEGMSFLPKGTPTNNYRQHKSGYRSSDEDAEASFRATTGPPLYAVVGDHRDKSDAQHLAEALGLDADRFGHVEGADQRDTREANRFNTLCWPATWGYYLQQFIQPKIGPQAVVATRDFFCNYVSGGGLLPSLRIHRQPYGFLATTAFSKWTYPSGEAPFLAGLHQEVLHPLFAHWQELTAHVPQLSTLSNPATLSEEFVKLLGLHASSVAYRQRSLLGDSLVDAMLLLSSQSLSGLTQPSITQAQLLAALGNIGLSLDSTTPLIRHLFQKEARFLNGSAIDPFPVSETQLLRSIPEEDFNRLAWLHGATWQDLRSESFFTEKNIAKPKDLLYLLIRHALLREYLQAGVETVYDNPYIQQLHLLDFDFDYLVEGNQLSPAQRQFLNSSLRRDLGPELEKEAAQQIRSRRITNPLARISFVNSFVNKGLLKAFQAVQNSYTRQPDKWRHLLEPVAGQAVGELIESQLANPGGSGGKVSQLRAMKAGLAELTNLPTARLERLFGEHLDLCHYRQDAWMLGLVHQRLLSNRSTHQQGIYLGAYGYLDAVKVGPTPGRFVREMKEAAIERPASVNQLDQFIVPVLVVDSLAEAADVSALLERAYVDLADDPAAEFFPDPATGDILVPPRTGPDTEGFLLTPSLDHAKAAAVLRAGYTAHRPTTQNAADAFAVNLSSDRVRTALHYLNGVQNGQPLAALLGYRFERSLYDHPSSLVLAQYVLDIRNKYPLLADQLTEDPANESVLVKEASHVVDGLALLKGFQQNDWHLGLGIPVPAKQAIDRLLQRLDDSLDAVNDLQMAESVYQMVKGNSDRAAAALRVLNTGGTFQWPEVIQVPRRGHLLTQRFGIFFPGEAEAGQWGANASPRARAAPGLNRWLGQQLPPPETIFILIRTAAEESRSCPLAELGIQPIDLVYQLKNSTDLPPMSELAQRVRQWARTQHDLSEGLTLEIQAAETMGENQYGLYEVLPLVRKLWSLLENSRPLRPADLQPDTERSGNDQPSDGGLDPTALHNRLDGLVRAAGGDSFTQAVSRLQDRLSRLADLDSTAAGAPDLQTGYDGLFDALLACAAFGVERATPNQTTRYTAAAGLALQAQARELLPELESRRVLLVGLLDRAAAATDVIPRTDNLLEVAQHLFGTALLATPTFRLRNEGALRSALAYPDLLKDAGPFALTEWLQGVAQVRPAIRAYQSIRQLREALGLASEHSLPAVAQLPFHPGREDRWVGITFPRGYEPDSDVLSLLLDLPSAYRTDTSQAGLLIDQWKEVIPDREVEAGIALQHNQPNTEAPQTVLLAVSPRQAGHWAWDDLMNTVKDTLALAKMRLVTPEIIEKHSPLSHLLPAVLPAVIDTDRGPSLDLTRNMRTPVTLPPFVLDTNLPTTGTIQTNP